ncbi:MAG: SUMF1/EgtB/PvdO family nonheme iron enzyme [Anaerolineae bacterium]|nr:SUMF1/EgtB/PvdO family nonheme iron enzyme [Anaerolineae bacterium]
MRRVTCASHKIQSYRQQIDDGFFIWSHPCSTIWSVLRGGSFSHNSYRSREAYRHCFAPSRRYDDYGFRVVMVRRSPSDLDY